ncbi:MAG: DNA cytosine methyltransferase [Burkholderiaceae bacterium]|nr:DNA cytosine methyltransferase [Burkholderiaceae bacterium]
MAAYYNECDPYAAQWLRNLIDSGHLPAGDVDTRSIIDVKPADLAGYDQCHFFAGIGGWSYALRLAGWPDDRPVWTGSCPCQPFSAAGKRRGENDERHLWPVFYRLIGECRPAVVFGEQVASPDGLRWLDGVLDDLDRAGYAGAAADLCAAGVGAPHIRQRLYWVGHAIGARLERHARHGDARAGAHSVGSDTEASGVRAAGTGVDAVPVLRRLPMHGTRAARSGLRLSAVGGVGDEPICPWEPFEALACADGWRRVRSGAFPLAHGVPARVGRLRAYGNAIVPQLAAAFVKAADEAASLPECEFA